ncbi:MAG: alpha/beta hydrolase [Actinomycetota bacterium]|nr:alpha/beta hydrolase [Actinomycetota bacterium]
MRPPFVVRQLAQLGFTANALHPLPGEPATIPSFFAGWLTSELAPHLAAITALDAARHVTRHGVRTRADVLGLVAAGLNLAGFAVLTTGGRAASGEIENALVEALGDEYREVIVRDPMPDDITAPWSSLVMPFRIANVDVVRHRALPYAPGGKRFLLDVFQHRDTPTDAPVLLQVHGGAWMIGNKDQQGLPLMLHMAARGWVCVAVNYPLSPKSRWPAHLVALKQAMRWIREHGPEYGADPAFVAVTGGSAGGHLAAMLALTSNDKSLQPGFEDVYTSVQACAPHYGVYDFTDESGDRFTKIRMDSLTKNVMARGATYPEDYRAASPLHRITSDAPPFLVVHGTNDTLVPVIEARRFVERLRGTSKQPVAYAEINGAQHAFDVFPSFRSAGVARGVARFLEWTHATRESRLSV